MIIKLFISGILDFSILDGSLYSRNFDYKIFMTISNEDLIKKERFII